jgi:hypothetical protein
MIILVNGVSIRVAPMLKGILGEFYRLIILTRNLRVVLMRLTI